MKKNGIILILMLSSLSASAVTIHHACGSDNHSTYVTKALEKSSQSSLMGLAVCQDVTTGEVPCVVKVTKNENTKNEKLNIYATDAENHESCRYTAFHLLRDQQTDVRVDYVYTNKSREVEAEDTIYATSVR